MTTLMLDGPRLAPQRGQPDSLVVFAHGFGSSGDDLIGLAEAWQAALPTTYFVAPDGPEAVPGMPAHMPGYQWFDLAGDRSGMAQKVATANTLFDSFLDRELARHKLTADRLVLVGFSQGTMLSLHCGVRRAVAPAAILGYAGALADSAEVVKAEATAKPPVMLIHGEQDDRIPAQAALAAAQGLGAAEIPVQWTIRPNLGHSIDEAGVAMGARFILAALSGRL
ncbi:MAG: alpha/beta hydrolase [Alphaproteobacteria bacterium]